MIEVKDYGAFKFGPTFMNVMKASLAADTAVMMVGEPGIGKSSFVQDTVENGLHSKVFAVSCNQLSDKADLTGCRTVEENGVWTQRFFPHQTISDCIEYANDNPDKTVVLFLDEINRTTSDVTSGCLSLITERRIGNATIPDNVRFIIAGNDKGNVTMLDSASKTRFGLLKVVPDAKTFLGLDLHLNPAVVKVLTAHPEYILCTEQLGRASDDEDDEDDYETFMDEDNALEQYTNPRTIHAVSRLLNELDPATIQDLIGESALDIYGNDSNQLRNLLIAFCGDTAFTAELLDAIADNLMNMLSAGTNQPTTVEINVDEPETWKELKDATTIDELNEQLNDLSDEDKSNVLIYALYNNEDNSNIINCFTDDVLANITPKASVKTLIDLARQNELDEDNVATFLNSGTNLAGQFSIVLENC